MKKLIALCLVLILAAPALTTNAESSLQKELNKELVKQLKKNYKKKKKELEKDRWKIYGSSKTLEVAFLAFCVRAHDGETLLELSADFFLHLSLVGGIEMLEFSVDVGRVCRDVLHDAGLHLSTGSLGVSHLGVGHSLTASDVV